MKEVIYDSSPTLIVIIAIQRAYTWGTELLQVPYLKHSFTFSEEKKSYGILMFLTHIRAYVCAQLDLFLISLFLLLMLPEVRMTS